jgi:hypothetical protein
MFQVILDFVLVLTVLALGVWGASYFYFRAKRFHGEADDTVPDIIGNQWQTTTSSTVSVEWPPPIPPPPPGSENMSVQEILKEFEFAKTTTSAAPVEENLTPEEKLKKQVDFLESERKDLESRLKVALEELKEQTAKEKHREVLRLKYSQKTNRELLKNIAYLRQFCFSDNPILVIATEELNSRIAEGRISEEELTRPSNEKEIVEKLEAVKKALKKREKSSELADKPFNTITFSVQSPQKKGKSPKKPAKTKVAKTTKRKKSSA